VHQTSATELRQAHVNSGLMVEKAAGPAGDAGIRGGDIIMIGNGMRVTNNEELRDAVERSKGHIALVIQRGGRQLFVSVRIPEP
jgi:serine protease Do